MYSIYLATIHYEYSLLFRDTILEKVTTRGRDHTCLLPSAILRHHSRDTIDEPRKARTLQRAQKVNKNRGQEQRKREPRTSECILFSCLSTRALSGPFTVLFSIVTGLEVTHQLFERQLLIPLVRFGSSGMWQVRAHAHKTLHTERSFQRAHAQRTPDTKSFEEGW